MIRLTFLLRRRPEFTLEQFQQRWRDITGPLVAGKAHQLHLLRYVQGHTVTDHPMSKVLLKMSKGLEPYDGVAEFSWKRREDLINALETDEGKAAMDELIKDEQAFIDLPNSPLWFANEYPQVNPSEDMVARENNALLKCYEHGEPRRLSTMTPTEAAHYWRTVHGPLVRMVAPQIGFSRYIQVHRVQDELEAQFREARGIQYDPYSDDPEGGGHAECWLDGKTIMNTMLTPDYKKAWSFILEDETRFMDHASEAPGMGWAAKENVFVDRRGPSC